MSEAKIRLSQKEMELVNNADWVLTKNTILEKANQLLAALQAGQHRCLKRYSQRVSSVIIQSSPRISKGENYQGLPYLILDYPRCFEQENIFAIRTMFWWGNFFSVTLHLSGIYKKEKELKLINSYGALAEKEYYCCINDTQWEHHFEAGNYIPLPQLSKNDFENLVREKSFIKLAYKIQLHQWDDAEKILLAYFKQIIEILAD